MKLIKPSFEVLEQGSDTIGITKQIERIGRICYKSEDKITEDSHLKFVNMLINRGHGAMLEHGTVYLGRPAFPESNYLGNSDYNYCSFAGKYLNNKYSKVVIKPGEWSGEDGCYVTTNYRVLVENGWLSDLQHQCKSTEYHEKRYSVRFVCDRGVSHELVRHRVFSFAQESTRYCNYSQDKFGNECNFIIPLWSKWEEGTINILSDFKVSDPDEIWLYSLAVAEEAYQKLLEQGGWQPQQARAVLPNSLKTEIVLTGFESDWRHFFSLRAAKTAHPQMQELAYPLKEEFEKRGYL